MRSLIVLTILISLSGCGRGFHARTETDQVYTNSDDVIDAYYIDDNITDVDEASLDQQPTSTEEQLKLPLDLEESISENKETAEEARKSSTAKEPRAPQESQPQLPLPEPTPAKEEEQSKKQPQVAAPVTSLEACEKKAANKDLLKGDLDIASSDLDRPQHLKPTIYYLPSNDIASFRSCKSGDTLSFKARIGQSLLAGKSEIRVCSKFYKAVLMQGSGLVRTKDNKQYLINYITQQDGIRRFKIVDRATCPYGLGTKNLCLQPFISIAADRNLHKAGDVIFVPAVAKARICLPDGDVHRGFFIVSDTGGHIWGGGRFDFYTGPLHYSDPKNPFAKIGLQSKANRTGLTYRLVKRGSRTEKHVQEYYKGRQIIPYSQ